MNKRMLKSIINDYNKHGVSRPLYTKEVILFLNELKGSETYFSWAYDNIDHFMRILDLDKHEDISWLLTGIQTGKI